MDFHYLNELISSVGENTDSVTLFGHNPSFTDLADSLCIDNSCYMTKCSVIGISFKIITWPEIKLNTGKLEYFLKPEKVL